MEGRRGGGRRGRGRGRRSNRGGGRGSRAPSQAQHEPVPPMVRSDASMQTNAALGMILQAYAQGDKLKCIELIRSQDPKVLNQPDSNGIPVLFRAVEFNEVDILRALLESGASPHATRLWEGQKQTAFDLAVLSGYKDCALLLFLFVPPREQVTFLHECCRSNHKRRARLYFARLHTALAAHTEADDITKLDKDGNTFLHTAVLANNPLLTKFILEAEADSASEMLFVMNYMGATPLHLAEKQLVNNLAVVAMLQTAIRRKLGAMSKQEQKQPELDRKGVSLQQQHEPSLKPSRQRHTRPDQHRSRRSSSDEEDHDYDHGKWDEADESQSQKIDESFSEEHILGRRRPRQSRRQRMPNDDHTHDSSSLEELRSELRRELIAQQGHISILLLLCRTIGFPDCFDDEHGLQHIQAKAYVFGRLGIGRVLDLCIKDVLDVLVVPGVARDTVTDQHTNVVPHPDVAPQPPADMNGAKDVNTMVLLDDTEYLDFGQLRVPLSSDQNHLVAGVTRALHAVVQFRRHIENSAYNARGMVEEAKVRNLRNLWILACLPRLSSTVVFSIVRVLMSRFRRADTLVVREWAIILQELTDVRVHQGIPTTADIQSPCLGGRARTTIVPACPITPETKGYDVSEVLQWSITTSMILQRLKHVGQLLLFDFDMFDDEDEAEMVDDMFDAVTEWLVRIVLPRAQVIVFERSDCIQFMEAEMMELWEGLRKALSLLGGIVKTDSTRLATLVRGYFIWLSCIDCFLRNTASAGQPEVYHHRHRNRQRIVPTSGLPVLQDLLYHSTTYDVWVHNVVHAGFAAPQKRISRRSARMTAAVRYMSNRSTLMPPSFINFVREFELAINSLIHEATEIMRAQLAMLLRLPDLTLLRPGLRFDMLLDAVNNPDDERAHYHADTMTIHLDRFAPTFNCLQSLVGQLTQIRPESAQHLELEVEYRGEPGMGPGPFKEFFEVCRTLFSTHNIHTTAVPHVHATVHTIDEPTAPLRLAGEEKDGKMSTPPPSHPRPPQASAGKQMRRIRPLNELSDAGMEGCFPFWIPANIGFAGCVIPRGLGPTDSPVRGFAEKVYRACGIILALSLKHAMPLGVRFPGPLLALVKGEPIHPLALFGADEVLVRSMRDLLEQPVVPSDELVFAFGIRHWDPVTNTIKQTEVELIPDGFSVQVTDENKARFVELAGQMYCFGDGMNAIQQIAQSFNKVVPKRYARLLTGAELCTFFEGETEVDVDELKRHVTYNSGYHAKHPVIRLFWHVVANHMDDAMRRKLLLFWTGSGTPSILGYDADGYGEQEDLHIGPPVSSRGNVNNLPEAGTCGKDLYLPPYKTLTQMREKLFAALNYGAMGFDRA